MGEHVDTRSIRRKDKKDTDLDARKKRTSFKQYLRQVEEELLETDLDLTDEELEALNQDD